MIIPFKEEKAIKIPITYMSLFLRIGCLHASTSEPHVTRKYSIRFIMRSQWLRLSRFPAVVRLVCLIKHCWLECMSRTQTDGWMVMYFNKPNYFVFVCAPCTAPVLKIVQVKHKDHSLCHGLHNIYHYYTLSGLGPFLNNEIIQGMAKVANTSKY